ncbi:accessory Sec system protein Asp2 [Listeria booriae]|uniref:Two component regulator three Y domain-containing protein n=1 Tax=Listeria booriae TaxID=1552123 RepID=A0A842A385_9LIST|nr:hypothetical protein [Listeria booriae]MBC1566850.1 hypothetical protein [Listeria booriae]
MKIMMKDLVYKNAKISLSFTIKSSIKDCEFAYYIYQDKQIIEKHWYEKLEKNSKIRFTPIYSGSYQIRLFIRKKDELVCNQLTNEIHIDRAAGKEIATTFPNEKVYFNDVPVKYLFQPAKKPSKHLILSFSGLYSTEFQGGAPVYNHIRTLEPVDANKLFILDSYQEQFCYYVGFGGAYDFERSVVALITTIANQLNIPAQNIIATGSSKGGAAALYYSLKYNYGKAIIGAPQIYIANYLDQRANSESMRERYNRILGRDHDFGKAFWNGLILNQVAKCTEFPEMHFHVGKGDFHYPKHLVPLFKQFDKRGIAYHLDLANYVEHNETGLYFTPFLLQKATEMTDARNEG